VQVKEIYSQDELQHHLEEAGPNSLVVVDFYRTACGSCKYIEKGFMKLCKGESEDEEEGGQHHVVFLKHNVCFETRFTNFYLPLSCLIPPVLYYK
jgi:thiol:disulfide interchange protein